jgi:peptide/nickel transport system permease protein
MVSYILRRLITSVLVLLGASFLIYMLIVNAGDPLQDLKATNLPNKAVRIAERKRELDLNTPPVLRFFHWLGGASKCFIGQCDFGRSATSGYPEVTPEVGHAIVSTLQLLLAATLLGVVFGVALGIVSALRQYSALDYSVTFASFVFYSMPVFWVAVLLKQFLAIDFNDFLVHGRITVVWIVLIAAVAGLFWTGVVAGGWRQRAITFGSAGAATALVLIYISATRWFQKPSLGPVVIAVLGVGSAVAATAALAGLRNRRALYATLTTVAAGLVFYFVRDGVFGLGSFGFWWLIVLLVAALAVAAGIGYAYGGYDRGQSMRASMLTAFVMSVLITLDRFMHAWPYYVDDVLGRPIATIGSSNPQVAGDDFWIRGLDTFSHLVLPTLSIMLISLASYSRYSRASMLEVMGQDYIRTARSKGVPERLVVLRHAFRNALIPLTTVVALDVGALIGGAVITETVFSRPGMGLLFVQSLAAVDPNPVMATSLVAGLTAVLANLVADLAYSVLDPRVRTA